jgi:hypothetical protein
MGNPTSKNGTDREKLPDLPIVGNQRKWNVIKVVLRTICLALSIIDVAELIAIQTASNALGYWPAVGYPVVSWTYTILPCRSFTHQPFFDPRPMSLYGYLP